MSQPTDLAIDVQSTTVILRTVHLNSASPWEYVRELIGRLLAAPHVEAVTVDRVESTATLHLRPSADAPVAIGGCQQLRAIAQGMRRPAVQQYLLGEPYRSCTNYRIQKLACGLTAGSIVSEAPGRIRLRHPLLRANTVRAQRAAQELSLVPGVLSVSVSSLTGSVLILARPGSIEPAALLTTLETVVGRDTELGISLIAGPPVSQWVAAGACLGLAVLSEFFVPGASFITAGALVANNLKTLGRGVIELCTFKWQVSSLYTVIMGTTLASGQFLAAALMQASITAWHGWTTHRLRKSVRELELSSHITDGLPHSDCLPELSATGVRRIASGSIVRVPVGAVLPFDGVVVGGAGEVDEHGLRGFRTFTRCQNGDPIFAGTELLSGNLDVKVGALNESTRMSAIRRTVHSLISEAIGDGGATQHGKTVASKFVPFTFATGTAALLAGDLTTLAAVLRPDFCTGPSLSDRLATLTGVSHLLHEGWLVRKSQALHALTSTRIMVVAEVQGRSDPQNTFESPGHSFQPATAASPTVSFSTLNGNFPTVDLHVVRGTAAECIEYVENLHAAAEGIAVASCQQVLEGLAAEDIVRISLSADDCLNQPYADLVALHSSPHQLEDLLRIVHEAFRPSYGAWSVILTCNALSISGAFLVGLTSLHVVVLTNLGALAAGILYNRHLKRSEALLASHVSGTPLSPHELFDDADQGPMRPSGMDDAPLSARAATSPDNPKPGASTNLPAALAGKSRTSKPSRKAIAEIPTAMSIQDQQPAPA